MHRLLVATVLLVSLLVPWGAARATSDIDGDGHVTLGDLKLLVAAWNTTSASINWDPRADLDPDGQITLADLKVLVSHWNEYSPTLAGPWGTALTYSATTTFGIPLPTDTSDQPCSVTFSSTFQPSTLPVCTGDSSKSIVLLSMSNLVNVGDQATANLQVSGAGRTYALAAQVTAVTRSARAYCVSMTMTIDDGSGPSTGPYTWSATLGSDGHVAVSGTAHYVYTSPIGSIITDVQSSGTLSRP